MENLNGRELIIMLRGEFERITVQLGKIEFRIIFFITNITILFFIYNQIINLYHIGVWFFEQGVKKPKNMRKKRSFQAGIHSTHDVHAFHLIVTVWCRESEPMCSRFCYNAHQRLRFVCLACEVDDTIFFYYIHFLLLVFYKYI
jgi:hypothetical protein